MPFARGVVMRCDLPLHLYHLATTRCRQ
jgi:hypothetical protein